MSFGRDTKMKAARMLAALAMVGLCFAAGYGADTKTDAKPLVGSIVKVDGVKITVKAADKEVAVTTDTNTKFVVNGKDAKIGDLKATMSVTITPADGIALKVEAKSAARG